MFACRGGLVEEEEGPWHSRVWEDEGRDGRRGKRWKTREEVEDEGRGGGRAKRWRTREEVEVEPLEMSFNVTVQEECQSGRVLPRFGSSSKPARLNERSTSALVIGVPSSATTSSDSGPDRANQNCIGSSTCLAFWLSMLTWSSQTMVGPVPEHRASV